jgi:hypothetical protein
MKKLNKWISAKSTHVLFPLFLIAIFARHGAMGHSIRENNLNDISSQKYYFEMDIKAQEEFFKKLKIIKVGDSVQKVKSILGEPTYDQTGVSKEKGEFRARVLKYYIKILEKGLVNEKYDRSVRLIFNVQGVLIEIDSNVEGYREQGNNSSRKYYFEMDKKAQEEFLKKLNSIKIGDSVPKVKAELGQPTYDRIGTSKKGQFIAREISYYIKILEKNLVNEKYDLYFLLFFDAENQLEEVVSNAERFHGIAEDNVNLKEILIPDTLEKQRELQKSVDSGHQPWKLSLVDVAHEAVSSYANKKVKYEECTLISLKAEEALVLCNKNNLNFYKVNLKKSLGKNSIWTATKIQIIKN